MVVEDVMARVQAEIRAGLQKRKNAQRRRLLALLSRKELEELSTHERKWYITRTFLVNSLIDEWDDDMGEEVKEMIQRFVTKAISPPNNEIL
jgi:hypothetical protein